MNNKEKNETNHGGVVDAKDQSFALGSGGWAKLTVNAFQRKLSVGEYKISLNKKESEGILFWANDHKPEHGHQALVFILIQNSGDGDTGKFTIDDFDLNDKPGIDEISDTYFTINSYKTKLRLRVTEATVTLSALIIDSVATDNRGSVKLDIIEKNAG